MSTMSVAGYGPSGGIQTGADQEIVPIVKLLPVPCQRGICEVWDDVDERCGAKVPRHREELTGRPR
jgi:hypothetical protein